MTDTARIVLDEVPLYELRPGRDPRPISGALFWGHAEVDSWGDVTAITLNAESAGDATGDMTIQPTDPLFGVLATSIKVHCAEQIMAAVDRSTEERRHAAAVSDHWCQIMREVRTEQVGVL